MRLRTKVFLVIAVVLGAIFIVVSLLLLKNLNSDFSSLESQNTEKNITRTRGVFDSKVVDLSLKVSDWSHWDATYDFVQDQNAEYVEENLPKESLETLKVNFAFITDEKNEVIFQKYLDQDSQETDFPKDLEGKLFAAAQLVSGKPEGQDKLEGILMTFQGPVLMSLQGTSSSDGSSPNKGTISFGYYLSQPVLDQLSDLTGTKVDFSPYEGEIKKGDFENAKQALTVGKASYVEDPGKNQYIGGYALVDDIFGKPALILRSQSERSIYEQREKTVALTTKIMVLLMTVFILTVFLLLEFLVLRRLSRFSKDIRRIGQSEDQKERLVVYGSDEFADLGKEINKMLETLHNAEMQRRENEGRFQILADSAPVVIWTADKEGNFTYVNEKILEVTGRSPEEHLGGGWKEGIHKLDLPRVNAILDRSLEKQQPFSMKYRLQNASGVYRWILMQATPEINYKGEFVGYLGSGFDITDVEEANERKLEYIREIENMNKIMVSRELKMIELKEEISKLKDHGESISNDGR